MTFGSALRAARRERRLTVIRLATIAGVSERTVRRIERDSNSPDLATLDSLAAGLGLDTSALLAEIELRRGLRSLGPGERNPSLQAHFYVLDAYAAAHPMDVDRVVEELKAEMRALVAGQGIRTDG
jgi:transcriptional regulator with XRE-family HTH domain